VWRSFLTKKTLTIIINILKTKPGGLNLSRCGLNPESQSQHRQTVCLDSRENVNIFKKFVAIEIEKFVETWKFRHFLTVRLDLDGEVGGFLHISC
jgi:hypothetical protein